MNKLHDMIREEKRIRKRAAHEYSHIINKYKLYKKHNNGSFKYLINDFHEAIFIWKWLNRDGIQCRIINRHGIFLEGKPYVDIYIEIDTDPNKVGYYTGFDILMG